MGTHKECPYIEMVRYADDFVILCRAEAEAQAALGRVQDWTAQTGLRLHPNKTRIVDARQRGGFDFLGYHFERDYRWPRQKSLKKFKDTVGSKTRRRSGKPLQAILTDLNRTLRGWFGYFKHSHRTTFPALDAWVRMRLRSVLRKRQGDTGERDGVGITSAGPTPSLPSRDCSLSRQPMAWPVNPL